MLENMVKMLTIVWLIVQIADKLSKHDNNDEQ